jgi:cardiolipin synthase C
MWDMSVRQLALFCLLASGFALQGCTVSRAQIRRADAVVAATTDHQPGCDRPDRCAVPSPLMQAASQALADSTPTAPVHVVTLLSESAPALAARINLIRAAQHSIDVQTYIWAHDDAGMLMLNELVDAARRGVTVRILADQLNSFDDMDLLDQLTRASVNLQVRLYNPTFDKARTRPAEFAAGILCCFIHFNQRMHNKLLLVDDTIGITGGRNYEDRYFNWNDNFDYVDRDVMVGGPAARQMAASFQRFWQHRRAVPLTHLRDVNRRILDDRTVPAWPLPDYRRPLRVARIQHDAEDPQWLKSWLLDPTLRTSQPVEYFSDLPAKTDDPSKKDALEFTQHLMKLVGEAHHEVLLQTPYLVMTRQAQGIFRRLHRRADPPRVIVSTNSLASTDAFAVYALSYKHRKRYLTKFGFEIHELKPHAPGPGSDYQLANVDADQRQPPMESGTSASAGGEEHLRLLGSGSNHRPAPLLSKGLRFGLHAKSLVIDDSIGMVGSHNFDPRSDHYNTEAGVIVYDRRFAEKLRRSIMRDTQPENSWLIAPRQASVPVLHDIDRAIFKISEQLPLFDLWPFRYATSYELKPGCQPMRASDPGFYDCYLAVGDFPDVAISPKMIITRLITAFGAGVKGVL